MKITLIIFAVIALIAVSAIVSSVLSWVGKASDVVAEQVDPARLLKTYEWFKDCLATCDKKLADIDVYKSRLVAMEESYEGTPRKDWDRTDKEQFNLWEQEVAGVTASYNSLAAEYNAAMAKINYRFTNVGGVPNGGKPLPREVREYKFN